MSVPDRPAAFRHVAVIGPGAVGTVFAVRLAASAGEAGPRVTLVDHRPDRAARLAAAGLALETPDGRVEARVPVVLAPREPVDLVLLATKAFAARAAAEAARGWIGEAPLVTLQNGLGVAEEVAEALPGTPVVVGVTYQAAHAAGEGVVRHVASGPTHLGRPGEAPGERVEAIAALFRAAGLPAVADPDIRRTVWGKLLVNAAINPVAALAGCPNGDLARRPTLEALVRALAEEGRAVAAAEGIDLPWRDAGAAALETARRTAANRCSMLADLEAGRPTEIAYLNGALVRAAEPHGTPVPANRAAAALVRQVSEATRGAPA